VPPVADVNPAGVNRTVLEVEMPVRSKWRVSRVIAAGLAVIVLPLSGCSGFSSDSESETVELTLLTGTVEATVQTAQGLANAFQAANPTIKINVDSSVPSGSEGDNLLKTRLATGDVPDVFFYNSGSLFQALSPDKTLLNLADEPWAKTLNPTFVKTVSTPSGLFGAPTATATGGGVFYYKPTYDKLGLSVPKTWAEFMANNQKLKAAGHDPVIQSYADTWTSQLFVLADFFNVYASDNSWADKYTKNQVKYATDPVAVQGFQHLQDVHDAGYLNKDFASINFDKALRKLAAGEGVHYPMLTFAIDTMVDLDPEAKKNVGFFAMPGSGDNGLTVWLPGAAYIPKGAKHADAAKKFLAFIASVPGCDAITKAVQVSGPYLVDGCKIPSDVPTAVSDMLPYFEKEGATSPALEFLSPVKGPALEQITVEVGSGIRKAKDGAALYDQDVKKQAQQLNLPGW
jgi:raffinose/stachyose/melibiose transport system substrate-binding protein